MGSIKARVSISSPDAQLFLHCYGHCQKGSLMEKARSAATGEDTEVVIRSKKPGKQPHKPPCTAVLIGLGTWTVAHRSLAKD